MMLMNNNMNYSVPEAGQVQAPHNIEAEQALLGAILIDNRSYDRIGEDLKHEHFYDPLHGKIYAVMSSLLQTDRVVTPITLKTYFENELPLGELTVTQYLGRLASHAASIINVSDYARIIKDMFMRRQIMNIAQDMMDLAMCANEDYSAANQIEEIECQLFQLNENGHTGKQARHISHILPAVIEQAQKAHMNPHGVVGLSTGLIDLDRQLGGLHQSDLIILAARPGMGKSSLGVNIAANLALQQIPVAIFTLEMSDEQIVAKLLSGISGVSSTAMRNGQTTPHEISILLEAQNDVSRLPVHVDATGGITIAQLATRARRMRRQHKIELLIIDYLQLMGSSGKYKGQKVQEVTEISMGLKALAKELDIPIIALSQLSRQVENREDKRPQLSDLRESGSIEQDADIVMFLYREEYYLEKAKPQFENPLKLFEWEADIARFRNKAELIIAKQRHGPTGAIELHFNPSLTKFSSLSKRDQ